MSEQIVENAFLISKLPKNAHTVLDFGGYESILPLQLSAIGYKVTVLDQRNYPFHHPNLDVICVDLLKSTLEIDQLYDVVISISTIEHLGLGGYGDTPTNNGDKQGVYELWKFVKNGGKLMASVPAGEPRKQRGYQVYDEKRIFDVFPGVKYIHWFKKNGREGVWSEVQADDVKGLVYDEPFGEMPVDAMAFVICEKEE